MKIQLVANDRNINISEIVQIIEKMTGQSCSVRVNDTKKIGNK